MHEIEVACASKRDFYRNTRKLVEDSEESLINIDYNHYGLLLLNVTNILEWYFYSADFIYCLSFILG